MRSCTSIRKLLLVAIGFVFSLVNAYGQITLQSVTDTGKVTTNEITVRGRQGDVSYVLSDINNVKRWALGLSSSSDGLYFHSYKNTGAYGNAPLFIEEKTVSVGGTLVVTTGGGATNSLWCEHNGSNFSVAPISGTSTTRIGNSAGTLAMQMEPGRKLGIGTTDPIEKLDVSGNTAFPGPEATGRQSQLVIQDQEIWA